MKISNSRIQTYKSCRRLYELTYIHNLKPVEKADALERGLSYHEKVEAILKGEEIPIDENIKANAMAIAFKKYIAPGLNAKVQEEWFEYQAGNDDKIIGRIDALNSDGKIIEHKTTSMDVNEYWNGLENNEQLLTYMIAYNTNEALYTVCKTPTIRQKKNETDEEFQQRCVEWYEEDTDNKIGMQEIFRSNEQLEQFKKEQRLIVEEMKNCSLFYKNPNHCMKWGRMCEFASICGNYNPDEEYVGFEKRS